jgi:hypothetical protein
MKDEKCSLSRVITGEKAKRNFVADVAAKIEMARSNYSGTEVSIVLVSSLSLH